MPPHLFTHPAFTAGTFLALVYFAAFVSIFFSISLLWQAGLGHTALESGLVSIPFAIGSIVGASQSTRLAVRLGRTVLIIGTGLVALGLIARLARAAARADAADLTNWDLLGPLLVAGFGSGLFIAPNAQFIVATVDPAEAGAASGVISTMQRIGSAIGIAVIGCVFFGNLHIPTDRRAHAGRHRERLRRQRERRAAGQRRLRGRRVPARLHAAEDRRPRPRPGAAAEAGRRARPERLTPRYGRRPSRRPYRRRVSSTAPVSTRIHLARRPTGWPTHDDFRTVRVELAELQPGEVRVRNELLSVDPYMRGRMNVGRSYVPPYGLDEVMTGGAIGRVVASRAEGLQEGEVVTHQLGWRDVAQGPAEAFRVVPDVPGVPLSAHLGVLGVTGFTAWLGLTEIAHLQAGDVVFVSGAAGAVGSVAGQLAKLKGASRTIGSAGGPEKARLLTQRYGYDAGIDYKAGPIREQLVAVTGTGDGEGIDVYFDNVGGDHLEAALEVFNDGGRAALCGAIAAYNDERRSPGPDNLGHVITRGLTLRGFTVPAWFPHFPAFVAEVAPWVAEGRVVADETVREGIDSAVDAFLDLMRGANTGKMLVRL